MGVVLEVIVLELVARAEMVVQVGVALMLADRKDMSSSRPVRDT